MAESPAFWATPAGERRRIEDYGMIGDCETAALVSRAGSIDWLCLPHFDSNACLAALLGDAENGYWRIAPAEGGEAASRRYFGETMILESLFETETGRVRLIDLMPLRAHASDLVRIVCCDAGHVEMRSVLDLRFQYGRVRPLVRRLGEREVAALAGPHAAVLRSSRPLEVRHSRLCCDFALEAGERVGFVLTHFESHRDPPRGVDPDEALRESERFWTEWASRCRYEGPHRREVVRSLLTLKALTYRPTGGTVAAATASLPEAPGGERNWDYRYCWLRDAAFMLLSFVHAGYPEEAARWRDWLLRAVAGEPSDVRPLYDVAGATRQFEWVADWLAGFNGSRPVRFGNAAQDQLQLDVFGEVLDAFHLARKHGLEPIDNAWDLKRHLLRQLEGCWRAPDAGIWESRAEQEHFVHSKVMAWVAFDRALKDYSGDAEPEDRRRWRAAREAIREQVLDRGYDRERGSFVRAYGSKQLDASLLLLPVVGFVDPCDRRMVATVEAIERELTSEGLVRRYDTAQAPDGLPPGEGYFLACSFWLADAYHIQGRRERAAEMFERLAGLANDLGLLSEQYSEEQAMLGNFPQALSHVALVNTAFNLSEITGPAEDRRQPQDAPPESSRRVRRPAVAKQAAAGDELWAAPARGSGEGRG
ncbi:MAG: glycoside hydrolase family 15 protein [Pseudomonadota bacterium]|nr:glycoside hydrolase family 15 protein [Pseudomonadota bacterium]